MNSARKELDLQVLEGGQLTGVSINEILVHKQWHADELVAVYLLRRYGVTHFPGIQEARIAFVADLLDRGDDYYDSRNQLPIGCGGGRFCEHRQGGRLKNMSATRLVLRFLEMEHDTDVKPLASRVNYCDNNTGTHPFELSELVKVMGRRMPNGERLLLNYFAPVLDALTEASVCRAARPGELGLIGLLREWISQSERHEKVKSTMFRLAYESVRSEHITSLSNMVVQLQRKGMSPDDIREWIMTIFEQVYADQLEFWKVLEEVNARVRIEHFNVFCRGERLNVPISFVRHDSWLALKACRYDDYRAGGVIVIRNTKGNVQIFTGPGNDVSTLVAMLRWLDLPKEIKHDASWKDLMVDGDCTIEGANIWHHHAHAGAVYNGTATHEVKPSLITDTAIIDAIQHAFDPNQVLKWKRTRGIK